ncbi:MAG: sulfotransferase family protein [Rhodobacteraceae bacterium]|nr:sulfotransferase family protein [Paracoccaceae bacterium]
MSQLEGQPLRSPSPLVDPVQGFALFTNAKCGGTTLKHWFFKSPRLRRALWSPLAAPRYFGTQVASRKYAKILLMSHLYAKGGSNRDVREMQFHYRRLLSTTTARPMRAGTKKFLMIRDPISRAVSGYVDKLCGEDRDTHWVRHVIDSCPSDSPSFAEFVDYLHRNRTNDAEFDAHWRRQTYVIDGLEDITFLRLEKMTEDMAKYENVWGDRDALLLASKRQSNSYNAAVSEGDMTHTSAAEVIAFKEAHGSFPKKEAFLNDEIRGLLREVYEKDFERFGIYD